MCCWLVSSAGPMSPVWPVPPFTSLPPAPLLQGEKNHGFDVLYHNMKHGQISTKELADFVRER